MMTRIIVSAMIAGALSVGAYSSPAAQHEGHDHADQKAETAVPMCPITGEPISYFVSTQTDEGPVYFCCKGCSKKYNKDTTKYAGKVAEQRAVLARLSKVQVTCPVSGEVVDSEVTVDHNGEKVAFCCKKCAKKFQKDPAAYEAKLAASYSYQTHCPVMGEEIDPAASMTLSTGETVYFCCKGCAKKLVGDPAKYNGKLVAQNINIDWEKAKPVPGK